MEEQHHRFGMRKVGVPEHRSRLTLRLEHLCHRYRRISYEKQAMSNELWSKTMNEGCFDLTHYLNPMRHLKLFGRTTYPDAKAIFGLRRALMVDQNRCQALRESVLADHS